MRIAVVSQTDNPWTGPYVRAFTEAGHQVRVFSYHRGEMEGADVSALSGKRPRWVPREIWFLGILPRLRAGLREFGAHVVFSPYVTSNGVTTALVWNGPYVVSARGSDVNRGADGKLPTWPWLHRLLVRFACRRAAGIHAVSEELAERLAECGVDRERIACFPLGVDLERLPPAPGSAAGPVRLVCTRRQESIYRNHVILDALSGLARDGIPFRCTLAGGGPLLEERRAQARELGLTQVEFTGQVPAARIGEILQGADIYISASLSDGTSSSLLEALATGAFPVVSRIRGNLAWIRDGRTGIFFDPDDVPGLERGLRRAIGDPELRARAAGENRALVEREGSRRANMRRMLSLVEKAAGGPG